MSLLRLQNKRPAWFIEVPLLVVGYVAFGLIRAAVDRGEPAATNNALLIQRLEQFLQIAVEYPLNHAMLDHPAAIYLTGYFYRLSVLAVPAILIWLYLSRSEHYRRLRTVLVLMMAFDLVIVWLFPEAPPRFALTGVVDYMATYDILGGASSRVPGWTKNLLAAMPSMHVAWTTWCAYAAWSVLRQRSRRAAWLVWLFPFLTACVVLVTGHHYILDILAGLTLVALTVQLTKWLARRRQAADESV